MGFQHLSLPLVTLFAISPTISVSGQLAIYNSDFRQCSPAIRTKGELADSLRLMGVVDRVYEIQGSKVTEYYAMNTAEFLGFAGDTNKFDLKRLPYLNRTPMMRRFVRTYGPETAHDIRHGTLLPGMLMQDIVTLHGWPERRKKIKGESVWTYENFELRFYRQTLAEVIRTPSGS